MADDLRQRYAEAIAAKFTSPVHRCDKWGENEWVENPEPSDRVGQSPRIVFTAGDGHPAFRTPTCAELAEVIAAVRDDELERLRGSQCNALCGDVERERDELLKLLASARNVCARSPLCIPEESPYA